MKLTVMSGVKTGLLISVLALSACGRPGLQGKGLALAGVINAPGKAKPEGPATEETKAEDEKLPPEAEQAAAGQVPHPPENVDPSIPGDDEELLTSDEQTQIFAAWDGKTEHADDWTRYTAEAIDKYGQAMLATEPADVKIYCPRWDKLGMPERKAFYVALISGIAFEESRFKTDDVYTESFKDSSGKNVKSRGLLQISKESGNYYGCGVVKETDLHDPKTNLSCGVRILNRWVSADQRIAGHNGKTWRGGSRYWAVLRNKQDLQIIRSGLKALPFCAEAPKPPPSKPAPPAQKPTTTPGKKK